MRLAKIPAACTELRKCVRLCIRMCINITRPTLLLHPFITKQNNSEQTALILMKNIAYTYILPPHFFYTLHHPPPHFLCRFSSRVYKNYEIPCILELVEPKKKSQRKKRNIYFVGACETLQFPRPSSWKKKKISK